MRLTPVSQVYYRNLWPSFPEVLRPFNKLNVRVLGSRVIEKRAQLR